MSFERSSGRRFRLRTTLALVGLVGSSLAMSVPARAVVVPSDPTPTESYVPKSGYTPGPRAAGRLTPATGALFGTHSDELSSKKVPAPTPKNPSATATVPAESADQGITKLEAQLGRTLDIDNHYTPDFRYYVGKTELDVQEQLDREKNRIPLIGWACANNADILSGSQDDAIAAAATVFKAYGRDFFMRYCWEMDGSRQPDAVRKNPDDFIKAWRYIHDKFDALGVTNVVWVWTANANGYKMSPPEAPKYYPGDDYVDWISADGYNWHGAIGRNGAVPDRYRNFLEIYDNFMLWARAADDTHQKGASTKPIMVAEYGTQEQHDDGSIKADWYRIAHDTVTPRTAATPAACTYCGAMSDIQAMIYFDVPGKSGNWYVNTTPKSLEAYKEAALKPWFNQIQTLTWGPYQGGTTDPGTTDPGTTDPGNTPPGTTPGDTPPGTVQQASGRNGYWMLGSDGKVYAFGQAKALGNATLPAGLGAADLEATPTGNGYWIVDTAGAVYAFGDAVPQGGIQTGQLSPGEVVTSLSSTPKGLGYWIFTNKGRAVRFGDATFFGDMSKTPLAGPVLDSIPTPTGLGYYMVGSDGGIFAFGDAKFHGSMGGKKLNAPVQSLVP
ncbi:MAG: hypothetical protein QOF96_1034, partial [Actinomycetota bacterium]|nr:hypothetical protein [Actinomycetota bacterium]